MRSICIFACCIVTVAAGGLILKPQLQAQEGQSIISQCRPKEVEHILRSLHPNRGFKQPKWLTIDTGYPPKNPVQVYFGSYPEGTDIEISVGVAKSDRKIENFTITLKSINCVSAWLPMLKKKFGVRNLDRSAAGYAWNLGKSRRHWVKIINLGYEDIFESPGQTSPGTVIRFNHWEGRQ